MKKLLAILVLGYRIMWDKLDHRLDHFGIKQEKLGYEQRKRKQTVESYSGSW